MSLGLSQKALAEKAGIHPQSVGKIERGQTTRLKQKLKAVWSMLWVFQWTI
ncbi:MULTISPECIES: helix-turn-helix transcriptional regulator [Cyanophyceae]|uniref:helix-turn-helix domain-containing protein n=1 Tax=Cyanophyceae TaxID=3028117 RepID=UPI001F556280|nr:MULTISPECIES: helix-turn-helix transcriptional regulator [unclassified Phormidium]